MSGLSKCLFKHVQSTTQNTHFMTGSVILNTENSLAQEIKVWKKCNKEQLGRHLPHLAESQQV